MLSSSSGTEIDCSGGKVSASCSTTVSIRSQSGSQSKSGSDWIVDHSPAITQGHVRIILNQIFICIDTDKGIVAFIKFVIKRTTILCTHQNSVSCSTCTSTGVSLPRAWARTPTASRQIAVTFALSRSLRASRSCSYIS